MQTVRLKTDAQLQTTEIVHNDTQLSDEEVLRKVTNATYCPVCNELLTEPDYPNSFVKGEEIKVVKENYCDGCDLYLKHTYGLTVQAVVFDDW